MGIFDFFTKERKEDLDQGLQKSHDGIFDKLSKAIAGKTVVDEETLDEIESALIASDIGVATTVKLIEALESRVAQDKYVNTEEVYNMLKDEIVSLLIGKLAYQFKKNGKSVMLGAADTFRAAAVEQLTIWSERVGVPIVKQGTGADPAAVAFDTVQSAMSKQIDVVLIDTAGRLHNKTQLMQELSKIKRALQKVAPPVPQDIMLVLDGSTGQNAFHQAQEFTKATEITCLAITKLDGTAKGGVVLGIADQLKVPVKYIGVGEGVEKLQIFNKRQFVDSLFKKK
jgi:fused signal recognition particle receptor